MKGFFTRGFRNRSLPRHAWSSGRHRYRQGERRDAERHRAEPDADYGALLGQGVFGDEDERHGHRYERSAEAVERREAEVIIYAGRRIRVPPCRSSRRRGATST
jgi:hypothetical protein